MIGEGLTEQEDASDRRAVDEWLRDINRSLQRYVNEGNLLLDGDGGPDYMAGIEDPETRQRVKNIQAVLERCIGVLDT